MDNKTEKRIKSFYEYCALRINTTFETNLYELRKVLHTPIWSYKSYSAFKYDLLTPIVKLTNKKTDLKIIIENKTKYKSEIVFITVIQK